jgi:hypothetical protein
MRFSDRYKYIHICTKVWSLMGGGGSRLATLGLGGQLTYPSFYVKELAMSESLVVGMLSSGQILLWSLATVLAASSQVTIVLLS